MALHLPDLRKPRLHGKVPRFPKNPPWPRLPRDGHPADRREEIVWAGRGPEGAFPRSSHPYPRRPGPDPDRIGSLRSVTVLLPALNEEAAVGSVIDGVPVRALRGSGYDVRVCVVDGRSTDATLPIARGRGADVFVQTGSGKGKGVRQALDHLLARPSPGLTDRFYIMLDADGSYPPDQMERLLDALESGADVVLGSRFLGSIEDGAITGLNRIGNRLLSALASVLYRVPVTDLCTGMWGFREGCLRGLGLRADGFDLEADLYSAACEAGARLAQVPVDYHRRIGEPKLIPLRTGVLIAFRLLVRKLNPPQLGLKRPSLLADRSAEGPA